MMGPGTDATGFSETSSSARWPGTSVSWNVSVSDPVPVTVKVYLT
jgi:hypothetical protein